MMEFGALPPEVNSGWIYAGPGAAPMLAAASTWHGLALELGTTAAAYQGAVARMAGELWTGTASASMVAAVTPYVAWMNTAAGLAEQAATAATAAAAAFETAYAMTVSPPLIVANRALLMTLVATNLLGQNTPAIAATEAQYAQMWAQDAAAMYGYAGSSAVAAQVTPFPDPSSQAGPAGLTGVTKLISGLPATLHDLASPLQAGSSAATLTDLLDPAGLSSMASSGGNNLVGLLSNMLGIFSASDGGDTPAPTLAAFPGKPALSDAAGVAGTVGRNGIATGVTAGIGRAATVGLLSVPPTWAASAGAGGATASLPGAIAAAAAERGLGSMPAGMPIGALGARPTAAAPAPNYGFRPTVTMHPVAAG